VSRRIPRIPIHLSLTLAVLWGSTACLGARRPPRIPAVHASQRAEDCRPGALPIHATPAGSSDSDRDQVAYLIIDRHGEAYSEDRQRTCVTVGNKDFEVAPGVTRAFEIQAHPTWLQELVVSGHRLLVHAPPGAQLRIADQPCFGWQLQAAGTDPWTDDDDHVECVGAEDACPEGFQPAPGPALALDPVCSLPAKPDRCIRQPAFRVGLQRAPWPRGLPPAAPTTDETRIVGRDLTQGEVYRAPLSHCGLVELRTRDEVVLLGFALGAKWSITLDPDGNVRSGRVEDPG